MNRKSSQENQTDGTTFTPATNEVKHFEWRTRRLLSMCNEDVDYAVTTDLLELFEHAKSRYMERGDFKFQDTFMEVMEYLDVGSLLHCTETIEWRMASTACGNNSYYCNDHHIAPVSGIPSDGEGNANTAEDKSPANREEDEQEEDKEKEKEKEKVKKVAKSKEDDEEDYDEKQEGNEETKEEIEEDSDFRGDEQGHGEPFAKKHKSSFWCHSENTKDHSKSIVDQAVESTMMGCDNRGDCVTPFWMLEESDRGEEQKEKTLHEEDQEQEQEQGQEQGQGEQGIYSASIKSYDASYPGDLMMHGKRKRSSKSDESKKILERRVAEIHEPVASSAKMNHDRLPQCHIVNFLKTSMEWRWFLYECHERIHLRLLFSKTLSFLRHNGPLANRITCLYVLYVFYQLQETCLFACPDMHIEANSVPYDYKEPIKVSAQQFRELNMLAEECTKYRPGQTNVPEALEWLKANSAFQLDKIEEGLEGWDKNSRTGLKATEKEEEKEKQRGKRKGERDSPHCSYLWHGNDARTNAAKPWLSVVHGLTSCLVESSSRRGSLSSNLMQQQKAAQKEASVRAAMSGCVKRRDISKHNIVQSKKRREERYDLENGEEPIDNQILRLPQQTRKLLHSTKY